MSTSAASITQTLVYASLSDAIAFVWRLLALCDTASQQARDALRVLIGAIHCRLSAATAANQTLTTTTTRRFRYTIRYAPELRSMTIFAIESDIVDWKTTIIDHADGSVDCIAMPVYADRPPRPPVETFDFPTYETIETAEELDVDEMFSKKDVCSVTCEEITTTTVTTTTTTTTTTPTVVRIHYETDDEATVSESEGGGDAAQLSAGEDTKSEESEAEQLPGGEEDEHASEQGAVFDEDDQQRDRDDDTDSAVAVAEVQSVWPTLTIDGVVGVEANAPFEWTIDMSRRPLSLQRAVGSVLLQRRLLGL